MVLHLEAGGCTSGADCDDVTTVAFDCYRSSEYTTDNDDDDYDFQCPTCGARFAFMSSLLQHAESDRCDETPERGPLAQFLRDLQMQNWA